MYHKGYTVKVYKTYYKDGEQVGDRIYLYTDIYPATRLAYIVGPEEKESPSPDIEPTPNPDEGTDAVTTPDAPTSSPDPDSAASPNPAT